jgi:COP9 signalosome complex subunit 5
VLDKRPWKKDPFYFNEVKVSTQALIKMLEHAVGGGEIEVMGLLRGKVVDRAFVILDAFPLPVEGTETRVNAGDQALGYIGNYGDLCDVLKKQENIVGWYHSHPNYGPWLSGIDVATQKSYQQTDPMVALVVDPIRSMIQEKIDIGAFRACPTRSDEQIQESEMSVPKNKAVDFGKHFREYYELPMNYFMNKSDKTIIDQCWKKYWINKISRDTLSSNPKYFDEAIEGMRERFEDCSKRVIAKNNKVDFTEVTKQGKFLQKATNEINQAVNEECVKALAFC